MLADMIQTQFSDYQQLVKYLSEEYINLPIPVYNAEGGLDSARKLLQRFGDPHMKLKTIHIAGTSGKGTVALMCDALLRSQGIKVGLHVSPHVYDMRERYSVDGGLCNEEEVLKVFNQLMPAVDELMESGNHVNYFVLQLVAAWIVFWKTGCEVVVLETGMGGLLDATNIANPDKICVINSIGLDHQNVLGNTIEEITYQKAGIIQEGNYVYALKQSASINQIIEAVSLKKKAKLKFIEGAELKDIWLKILGENWQLAGLHNRGNLSLAIEASNRCLELFGKVMEPKSAYDAVSDLYLPGRFEAVNVSGMTYILDGAHNSQKVSALIDSYRERYNSRCGVVFATSRSENYREQLKALESVADKVILTSFSIMQETSVKKAHDFSDYEETEKVQKNLDLKSAIESTRTSNCSVWLICGSFYLLEPARRLLDIGVQS